MSATEFIQQLQAMPPAERERVFARLVENQEWRDDLVDLMTIAERRNEPTRPIDEVFRDLNIDAGSGASSLHERPRKNWQNWRVTSSCESERPFDR
jgi:hypothetical protein